MMMGMCYNLLRMFILDREQRAKGSEPAMMKKILCLIAALTLFAVIPAAAEDAGSPVTAAELAALLESVRSEALASSPLNDPADESAQSEDGTLFRYEIARIYAEGTKLSADTPVNALVYEDSEGPVFRGTGIDTTLADLLAAYPLNNPELAGTREEAVLYLADTEEGGFVYGRVLRDGQRISAVEYGEFLPEGELFRRAAVTYTMTQGLVSSIRVEGLNPAGPDGTDAASAEEFLADLRDLYGRNDYRMVKTSRNGLDLMPFAEEDLIFSGISYLTLTPDSLPGMPERELIDNEDGTWIMRCDGDGYEAVFRCGANGENAELLSFSILDDETEGPRCVRLGDLFSDDFNRFRNGENEMSEDLTELLYGTEDSAPRGFASYDSAGGEMSLLYVTPVSGGSQVELILKYTDNVLTEIILRTV